MLLPSKRLHPTNGAPARSVDLPRLPGHTAEPPPFRRRLPCVPLCPRRLDSPCCHIDAVPEGERVRYRPHRSNSGNSAVLDKRTLARGVAVAGEVQLILIAGLTMIVLLPQYSAINAAVYLVRLQAHLRITQTIQLPLLMLLLLLGMTIAVVRSAWIPLVWTAWRSMGNGIHYNSRVLSVPLEKMTGAAATTTTTTMTTQS